MRSNGRWHVDKHALDVDDLKPKTYLVHKWRCKNGLFISVSIYQPFEVIRTGHYKQQSMTNQTSIF